METADAVVIGGGCMGASVLYNLALRGLKNVVLLEKGRIPSGGGTAVSSGAIQHHYGVELLVRTARRSLETFSNFAQVVGGDCGFVRTGYLVGADEPNLAALSGKVAMQKRLGVNVQVVTPSELAAAHPLLDVEGIAGAAFETDSGYADAVATTRAYARRASDMGARIQEHAAVLRITRGNGRVSGVVTQKGEISTPLVVLASGARSRDLAKTVEVDLPIEPHRRQICVFQAVGIRREPYPIYVDLPTTVYFKLEVGGTLIVGSFWPVQDPSDPEEFSRFPDQDVFKQREAVTRRRFPKVHLISKGGYCGIYDMTPDIAPLVGEIPGTDGLYCTAGWSGHGFKHSPAIGELLSSLIVDGERAMAELAPLRVTRFAEGKPTLDAYPYKWTLQTLASLAYRAAFGGNRPRRNVLAYLAALRRFRRNVRLS